MLRVWPKRTADSKQQSWIQNECVGGWGVGCKSVFRVKRAWLSPFLQWWPFLVASGQQCIEEVEVGGFCSPRGVGQGPDHRGGQTLPWCDHHLHCTMRRLSSSVEPYTKFSRIWYRGIYYCSVSIEFGTQGHILSQTLWIRSNIYDSVYGAV